MSSAVQEQGSGDVASALDAAADTKESWQSHPAAAVVKATVGRSVIIVLNDMRELRGICTCFDWQGNLVLSKWTQNIPAAPSGSRPRAARALKCFVLGILIKDVHKHCRPRRQAAAAPDAASGAGDALQTSGTGSIMVSAGCTRLRSEAASAFFALSRHSLRFHRSTSNTCAAWPRFKTRTPRTRLHDAPKRVNASRLPASVLAPAAGGELIQPAHARRARSLLLAHANAAATPCPTRCSCSCSVQNGAGDKMQDGDGGGAIAERVYAPEFFFYIGIIIHLHYYSATCRRCTTQHTLSNVGTQRAPLHLPHHTSL